MLRGEHIESAMEMIEHPILRQRDPEAGDTVYAIDEDGARYLAVLESVEPDGFVTLRLKLDSRYFSVSPQPDITLPTGEGKSTVNKSGTIALTKC